MSAPEKTSHMQHMSERDDALPFRDLERAHRRRKLAEKELVEARADEQRAMERLLPATGYKVRLAEPGDDLEARAPIGAERYDAEKAA